MPGFNAQPGRTLMIFGRSLSLLLVHWFSAELPLFSGRISKANNFHLPFTSPSLRRNFRFAKLLSTKFTLLSSKEDRNSSVSIVIVYEQDDRGVGVCVLVGQRIFSTSSRSVIGPTQNPVWCVQGNFSPGVEREANHSPLTSADVRKMWIDTSSPPYAVTA
jgi:hypothetical protein